MTPAFTGILAARINLDLNATYNGKGGTKPPLFI
jgi:hypothetical protein